MSSLLTLEEYQSLSKSITLPTGAFIDGKAKASAEGKTFETLNPATGQSLAKIAACDESDVDLAVEKRKGKHVCLMFTQWNDT